LLVIVVSISSEPEFGLALLSSLSQPPTLPPHGPTLNQKT
jgi:hypothetical protein